MQKTDESNVFDSLAMLKLGSNVWGAKKMLWSYQPHFGHKSYCKSDNNDDFIDQKPFYYPHYNRVFKYDQTLHREL